MFLVTMPHLNKIFLFFFFSFFFFFTLCYSRNQFVKPRSKQCFMLVSNVERDKMNWTVFADANRGYCDTRKPRGNTVQEKFYTMGLHLIEIPII